MQEDDAKYAEYFWWKEYYEVRNSYKHKAKSYCDLCKRLHDPHAPHQSYKNMVDWWQKKSHCRDVVQPDGGVGGPFVPG